MAKAKRTPAPPQLYPVNPREWTLANVVFEASLLADGYPVNAARIKNSKARIDDLLMHDRKSRALASDPEGSCLADERHAYTCWLRRMDELRAQNAALLAAVARLLPTRYAELDAVHRLHYEPVDDRHVVREWRMITAAAVSGPQAPAGDAPGPQAPAATPGEPLKGEAKALALLVQHLDWTDSAIAKAVPCRRQSLYGWPKFKAARQAVKESGKEAMPRGSKSAEGDMEAWGKPV